MKIKIILPDKKQLETEKGVDGFELAEKISKKLAKEALAIEVNGELRDLSRTIEEDAAINIITSKDSKGKDIMKHSAAHILAYAVTQLFPEAKPTIGPVIEDGFFYDFYREKAFDAEEIKEIEEKARNIIESNYRVERHMVAKKDALSFYKNNKFKKELIKEFEGNEHSFYKMGKFDDLCRGPHIPSTGLIKGFKIVNDSSAYWRGDEKREVLRRLYGVAFPSKKELEEYLKMREEAIKRDHRKLGPELGLFFMHDTSPGMPYWLPKGLRIYQELVRFWKDEHDKLDYQEIATPLVNKKELWETSGHWEHYQENMFIADMGENEIYGLKAMNCPNAMVAFAFQTRSYRDLPLKLSDKDMLHRYERSGTLHGLLRVRSFSQDDAHIFVTPEQIEQQYEEILGIAERFYKIFGLNYTLRLGTRPEKYMGDPDTWEKAEASLKRILEKSKKERGLEYSVLEGDGAFYGPKIDIVMKDGLGREWQTGTVQLDFQQPRRFNLSYVDKNGSKKTPVVIHRVIYGSLERFIGLLIEHFAGAFPTWISPEHVRILPITDRAMHYSERILKKLTESGIRASLDRDTNTIQYKIRNAQLSKVPYMLVIGDKEVQAKNVTVRKRDGKVTYNRDFKDFIKELKAEIKERKLSA